MKKKRVKKVEEVKKEVKLEKEKQAEEATPKRDPFLAWNDLLFPKRRPEVEETAEVVEEKKSEDEADDDKKPGRSWI